MDLLYLSHCVPNPPDKGERIRAHHIVRQLSNSFRVHVAAFARSELEIQAATRLKDCCASIHVEPLSSRWALARAASRALTGDSLMMSFYRSSSLAAYVDGLTKREPIRASVAFSTAMAQYAPRNLPLLLDMTDVDSEKWFQYARLRTPGWLYAIEGRRLRAEEIRHTRRAATTFLATTAEADLLRSFVPGASVDAMENGVDFEFFDPAQAAVPPDLLGRRYIVFVGVLDYFPNQDGVIWFANRVFPQLRAAGEADEFLIVGRNPPREVQRLGQLPGVTIVANVPDVRAYLAGARAVVAPLRLARGIQNKVLEGLAMGKKVLASTAVVNTFGKDLPHGVVHCPTEDDYLTGLRTEAISREIRAAAEERFVWHRQAQKLTNAVRTAIESSRLLDK